MILFTILDLIQLCIFTINFIKTIIDLLSNDLFVSYVSIAIGILLTVYIYNLQKREQKEFVELTQRNNELTQKIDNMLKYQNRTIKIIGEIYANNSLHFLHGIKSPLLQINNKIRYIIDEVIKYLYGEQNSDTTKKLITIWAEDIQNELNRLEQFFQFYRDYINYAKFNLIRNQLIVDCSFHNIGPFDFLYRSDDEINYQYMIKLDIVIETLLEFQQTIINEEQKINNVMEEGFII